MDHLPKPTKPVRQPPYPEVPYLRTDIVYPAESIGYEAFKSFPTEHGISIQKLQLGDLELYGADRTLAIIQSWLFFGVLTETFSGAGIPFNQEDFRHENDDGSWLISTEHLERYLFYWMAALGHQGFESRRQHACLVDSCLRFSNTVYMATITGRKSLFMEGSIENSQSAVLLSIAILGEVLTNANRVLTNTSSVTRWPFPPLAWALLAAGWCVGDITTMNEECDSSTLLYLSTLGRHELGKSHERCSAQSGCQAFVVDWETYRTKHIIGCSEKQCDDIGPSIEEVGLILRDGDIPLIAMDTSTSTKQLEVIRYKEQSEYCNVYVAISHVWSDGLGNPKENRLPRCQLERIQHLVNKLDPDETYLIPFWIDTICVPLTPELKSLAIENMGKTYRNATSVLVLDNSLKDVTIAMPAVEIMMRIRYSTWMTRLWTFQEARLSRNLWFQLQDGPVHIDDVGVRVEQYEAMHKVSTMLLKEDKIQIVAHPNKLQLARALAYQSPKAQESLQKYAVLPEQNDEEEEAARLSAIQILSENRELEPLRSTWHQIIAEINPESPYSDFDGNVLCYLSINPDQVASYAMIIRPLVKGIGGAEAIGTISPQATKPGRRPWHHLVEVIRGIRGRTTSRLEDETICLSVLLGLDVRRVVSIPVLHWNFKDLLAKLRELVVFLGIICPYRKFFHVFVDVIERLLRSSQEDRMIVFLSQFVFFPAAMLFWNTRRLQRKGWRWAPFSFLPKDLDTDAPLKGGPRGWLTGKGLLIKRPAISLPTFSFLQGSDYTMKQPTRYDRLRVGWSHRFDALPNGNSTSPWEWIKMYRTFKLPTNGFSDLQNIENEHTKCLVIFLEDNPMSPDLGNNGALLSIHRKQGQCICVNYITALTAIEEEPNPYTLRASGRWVPKRWWCVA